MDAAQVEDFKLFRVTEADGKHHTLLQAPRSLPTHLSLVNAPPTHDAFNILMADVSGSMSSFWPYVVNGWQMSIQGKLTGRTKIFVFGSIVSFVRVGTELTEDDYCGGGTDLTSALQTVRHEVDDCSEHYVRVFIITDGAHGFGEPLPDTEIEKMSAPLGKTVDVFLLGLGYYFPVNYSIDIRSRMHNGSANLPSLFWAKELTEIEDQMMYIGTELSSGLVKLSLNHHGSILPGIDKTEFIHLGEWQYFCEPPEEIPMFTVQVDDQSPKMLSLEVQEITMELLLHQVFRQWNSVVIQRHRKKEDFPKDIFDLMDTLFRNIRNKLNSELGDGNNVKVRLQKKKLKGFEVDYATLMNQSKTVIGIEGKYQNEIELAETILMSTVTNKKFDTRLLKMRGHGQDDYDADVKAFCNLYEKTKHRILELPQPTPEECCRITASSTLQDMQDPDFLLMLNENKFDLMKCFTMTGIPVYAPVRDASQINPWTMCIKHILVTPFTILSQRAIEAYADFGEDALGAVDKDVLLQKDNEKTRFNAIIPIIPVSATSVLKPFVRSNLYAMLATFCILKNPHVIDHNAHIAALGCAWVRSVSEFPLKSRPQFICDRLEAIVATADVYMDRDGIVRYLNALINHPKQALMTESVDMFDGNTLKCESLIKPLFFTHLIKKKLVATQTENLLKLMLGEFIGRCLSRYGIDDADATPFTDFFAEELNNPERKKNWLEKHYQKIAREFQMAHGNLVEKFFTLDELRADVKQHVLTHVATLSDKIAEEITININIEKIKKLKNLGSCGDVSWAVFRSWAEEMDITNSSIEEAFDPAQVMVYVSEALHHRSSRERLSKEPDGSEQVFELVKKKVTQENARNLKGTLLKEVEKLVVEQWRETYMAIHSPLVMPLTQEQVVEAAKARGIEVTVETFGQIYRYDVHLKLLRNACQILGCPHYLIPRRSFNQHLSVERESSNFPHALHVVSHKFSNESVEMVAQEITKGTLAGHKKRKIPLPPEPSSLNYLKNEMQSLLLEYRKDHIMNAEPQQEEGEDQFYDCMSE
ncbi:uncharacterized protein [Panulirus ornatus]